MHRPLGILLTLSLMLVPLVMLQSEEPAPVKRDPLVIGATLIQTRSGCKIRFIYKDSPAEKAGLRGGDVILQVDGQSVEGMELSKINRLIQERNPVRIQARDKAGKTKNAALNKVPSQSLADAKGRFLVSSSLGLLLELDAGDMAPDITAQYLNGRQIKLSDWRGKAVLVVFWDSQFTPYVEPIAPLIALYQKYHDKGLEILGVSLEPDKLALDKFVATKKIPWPQHFDGQCFDGGVVKEWGVFALPVVVLVGKDGKIVSESLNEYQFENAVETELGLPLSIGPSATLSSPLPPTMPSKNARFE
ncbi:MAG: hypothetical protein B9S32_06600 [Verrucomicrobia bacterium Tous-C9LFEB]|nr:MAG: hypothetical protein B9S32_06600 [Verrucomicrobia bacterium Tous-C9LFEB]